MEDFSAAKAVRFNQNLNCFIGGRGTGKSTAFSAIRHLADGAPPSGTPDLEVCPDASYLLWEDQSGKQHKLRRRRDERVENVEDDLLGPTGFAIDCFEQGEAQRISIEAKNDPLALQRYLDRFVPRLQEALDSEQMSRDELLRLQTEIEKAEQQVSQIPSYERLLSTAQQQLAVLKKPDVKELIELQQHLSQEKALRKQIAEQISIAKKDIGPLQSRKAAKQIAGLATAKSIVVGKVEFQTISTEATALETSLIGTEASIKSQIESFESSQFKASRLAITGDGGSGTC